MKKAKRKRRLHPNTLQLIRQIVGGVLLLCLLVVLIVSTWYVTRLPGLTLVNVAVSGGETIEHEVVRSVVMSELDGEYLGLVPRRFVYLYPKSSILNAVQAIERIKDVELERISATSLAVSFAEYVPDALWCDAQAENCVFLDETGYAFAPAPDLTGGSFLRLEKLAITPVSGTQAFTEADYAQINQLVSLLEQNTWFVRVVAVDAAGDAYLSLVGGGELKVALTDEPAQIIDNLFTVLNSPEFTGLGPGEFEYIDLRFGNKVFVNDLEPDVATTTTDALE
jgi:cell division septal protein FtsQ